MSSRLNTISFKGVWTGLKKLNRWATIDNMCGPLSYNKIYFHILVAHTFFLAVELSVYSTAYFTCLPLYIYEVIIISILIKYLYLYKQLFSLSRAPFGVGGATSVQPCFPRPHSPESSLRYSSPRGRGVAV